MYSIKLWPMFRLVCPTVASKYIVQRVFPSHPLMAVKILKMLAHMNGKDNIKVELYDQEQQDLETEDSFNIDEKEEEEKAMTDSEKVEDDMMVVSDSDFLDVQGSVRVFGRPIRRKQKKTLTRPIRRQKKRGLGRCIINCLNGELNFIECKSMCHWSVSSNDGCCYCLFLSYTI